MQQATVYTPAAGNCLCAQGQQLSRNVHTTLGKEHVYKVRVCQLSLRPCLYLHAVLLHISGERMGREMKKRRRMMR